MFEGNDEAVFQSLAGTGLFSPEGLAEIQRDATTMSRSFADIVVQSGVLGKGELLKAVSTHRKLEFAASVPVLLPAETTLKVPAEIARRLGVIPFRENSFGIELLTRNPFDREAASELEFALDRRVTLLVADPDQVDKLILQHYGAEAGADVPGDSIDRPDAHAVDEELSEKELEELAAQAPVVRLVSQVLGDAIRAHASDIHFEPFEHEFKIRYRVDGALFEIPAPPRSLALPITSRLKVLANLDITERRRPLDGRLTITADDRTVDLRVSTLPTQFGESIVLRVLDPVAVRLDLAELGMAANVLEGIRSIVERPNGIFVVTGPTGSGKTTTLYSALRAINTPDRKLLTAEDPVEYEVDGLIQVPVNPGAGLTFASVLRSFLRQDPDAIMVGEIRDLETAQVAVQASLTGHLVFSTLHTNEAAGAVTRLVDMGIEPFLIASSLEGVLAQRLVRRICVKCRSAQIPAAESMAALQLTPGELAGRSFYHGAGCAHCGQSGYKGRLGLFEWLPITEAIRELVTNKASTLEIREKAIEQGMQTLRESGLRAIFAGETTVDEVVRCT